MFAQVALPNQQSQLKQDSYKASCDEVLLNRANNKKPAVAVQFKNGSSKSFLFALAKK